MHSTIYNRVGSSSSSSSIRDTHSTTTSKDIHTSSSTNTNTSNTTLESALQRHTALQRALQQDLCSLLWRFVKQDLVPVVARAVYRDAGYISEPVDPEMLRHMETSLREQFVAEPILTNTSQLLTDLCGSILKLTCTSSMECEHILTTLMQSKLDYIDTLHNATFIPLRRESSAAATTTTTTTTPQKPASILHVEVNRGMYIPGAPVVQTQQSPTNLSCFADDSTSNIVAKKREGIYNVRSKKAAAAAAAAAQTTSPLANAKRPKKAAAQPKKRTTVSAKRASTTAAPNTSQDDSLTRKNSIVNSEATMRWLGDEDDDDE
jgi:hypothetical protein